MVAPPDEIVVCVQKLQSAGKTVVFTNGCFDILHSGHIDLLRRARALGDALVVAINSDSSIARIKGAGRPIVPQHGRESVDKPYAQRHGLQQRAARRFAADGGGSERKSC